MGFSINNCLDLLVYLPKIYSNEISEVELTTGGREVGASTLVERIRVLCSVQIFYKDFFGPIFFALCPQ